MITVREAINLVRSAAESVTLTYAGNQVLDFNWGNSLAIEAYGNFMIDGIYATGENRLELDMAVQPIAKACN